MSADTGLVHPSLGDIHDRANTAFARLLQRPHKPSTGVRCTIEQARAFARDTRRGKFELPPLTVDGRRVDYEIVATRFDEQLGADVVWLEEHKPEKMERLHAALAELAKTQQFVRAVIHRVAEDTFSRFQKAECDKHFRLGWHLLSCEDRRKEEAANPTDQRPLLTSYALRAFEALTSDHIESVKKRELTLVRRAAKAAKAAKAESLSVITKAPRKRAPRDVPISPPVARIIVPGPDAGPMRIHVSPYGIEAMLVYSVRYGGKYGAPYDLAYALKSARANLSALVDTMEAF
jgi:hypothetical protein